MVHQYKLNGYDIVLDTCSGSVHTVDEVAYDIIAMYKESTPEEIVKVIMERYGNLPDVNEEEILASFQQKTRYNIRVAIKKGVEVKLCGEEALHDFHQIMVTTGTRDNFVVRTEEYFRKMMRELGEHARLYMAYLDGKAIAGTLAIGYGDKVWYLYGASSNEYRNVMPNYLLQWEMIKWAIERGARVYDFRGVSGNLSEDNPLYGLYRFKRGFNGEFTEFVGEMDLVYNKLMLAWSKFGSKAYRRLNMFLFKLKHRG